MTPEQQHHIRASLNLMSSLAYNNAKEKGFHDIDEQCRPVDNYARWTVNLHGEVSELWEAARKDQLTELCDKAEKMADVTGDALTCEEEELADIIIRVLDTAKARNVDIGRAVILKHLYNASRPHMHGKLA